VGSTINVNIDTSQKNAEREWRPTEKDHQVKQRASALEIQKQNTGFIDPFTGKFYPPAAGGAIDPETGTFFHKVGGGYINTQTGAFVPASQ
jgi:hypothetical protein